MNPAMTLQAGYSQAEYNQRETIDFAGAWLATTRPASDSMATPTQMLLLCNRDGHVIASRPLGKGQAKPSALVKTPGEGAWQLIDGGKVAMTASLYWQTSPRYSNLKCKRVGIEMLRMLVQLDPTGESWRGALTVELLDPNGGNLLSVQQSIIEATRVHFAQMDAANFQ